MKKYSTGLLALLLILIMGCKKEQSFEVGNNPSKGSLQSDITGDCLPKTVNGNYVAGTPVVPATNTITVSVDVTKTGIYTIYTDTVNGYFFRGTGIFTKTGITAVTLRSNGTPLVTGVNNFVVNYDSTFCDIAVTVTNTPPAVFTLEGAPNNCTGAVVNGSYATANTLNFTNTVRINVNVTTAGTYSITTTKNGMTFSATGIFTATGVQPVTLTGSGTPTVNGDNVIPVTVGTSTCNFTVPVGTPAVGFLGGTPGSCTPVAISGTYTAGTPLVGASNTVQIQVNVTTLGVYSIATNTVNGISFAASGSFTVLGAQALTLNGTGTPAAGGTQNFIVTFGTSSCNFNLPVNGPAGAAVFSIDCGSATINGTYTELVPLNSTNTVDIDINVTTPGTYDINFTVNGMTFSKSGTFTAAGITTITLVGSGTPAADGTFSVMIQQGTTPCLFVIDVDPGAGTIDWSFKIGATIYQGQSSMPITYITTTPPFSILSYFGDNLAGDECSLTLIDIAGGITATEQYATTSTTTNTGAFYFFDMANTIDLTAEPPFPPAAAVGNMVFRITSHSTATKTIIGTFSGTAFDAVSNTTKTITDGNFTAKYQ